MFNKKIIISLIVSICILFSIRNVFAQGVEIGGTVAFSYITSDGTRQSSTLEDSGERYSHNYNYSLNIKNDLTDKGSARSSVRYSISDGFETKSEATTLSFDLSYDKISCSLALQDNTNSVLRTGVTNNKATGFSFQISPEILPRISFSYASSINDSEITSSSNNTFNMQLSKNFKIQNSQLSTAVSYGDDSDNLTGKQNTNNMFNMDYNVNLMDDKISLSTGYRVGNNYDVNNAVSNINESGDFNFGYSIFENLNVGGNWAKNSTFSSESARKDVSNNNSYRFNYTPLEDLSFALSANFNENQTGDLIDKSVTKDFSTRFPPIFDIITINYSYGNNETENTLSANNNISFDFNLGPLNVSDFTSNARYGTNKTKSIDTDTYSESMNIGYGINTKPIENVDFSYAYSLDKSSDVSGGNKDAIKNTISVNYGLKLMEDLNCLISTSYNNNQNLSESSSGNVTTVGYNGSVDYKIGKTNVNFTGSLSQTFDESGVHISQRSDIGPGINTKIMGINLTAKASFNQDATDGELTSTNNTNYSLNGTYPIGSKGSTNFTYTSISQENIKDSSLSQDTENISINVSFTF